MEQNDCLRLVIEVLERLKIPYLICGSVASAAYGEPRMTLDIDIVVDLRLGQVSDLCAEFPAPEFYVRKESAREAVLHGTQFNVVHPATGNKIDFMISGTDAWSQAQLARRQKARLFGSLDGFTASPEDIIISKMRYYHEGGSEKHLRDIAGILAVKAVNVDRDYVSQWATRFGVSDVWQAILRRVQKD